MPRKKSTPAYRQHKQSGQAIVTLPDGMGGRRDVLLGQYDSPESRAEYVRVVTEWETSGRRLPLSQADAEELTINELLVAYWRHVEAYYVKDGQPTSEQTVIRRALSYLKNLYGHTPAKDFSPASLKTIREAMTRQDITCKVKVKDPETGTAREAVKVLRHGLTRKVINKQIGRVKRVFAWAVEEGLLFVTVYQALTCVKGLRKGKHQVREKPRVGPVPEAHIEAVLPHVPETIRTMIQVQRLCGGRPQDIVEMRAIDIDMTGPVWEYRPRRYKTEHHNEDDSPDRERIVFLGPKAQELLKPYLSLNLTDYLFSPRRSEQTRNEARRGARKSKLWPSHAHRQATLKRNRKRPALRDRYDVASYRRAIRRACEKAGIPIWFPNQLRHSAGTLVRKQFGLEASQAVLGHSELGVTQVYAEVDRETARKVMAEIG